MITDRRYRRDKGRRWLVFGVIVLVILIALWLVISEYWEAVVGREVLQEASDALFVD